MRHVIVRFENGGGSWAEFECGACQVDVDLFDFDLQEVTEAAEDDLEFECPNCRTSMLVSDLTPQLNALKRRADARSADGNEGKD